MQSELVFPLPRGSMPVQTFTLTHWKRHTKPAWIARAGQPRSSVDCQLNGLASGRPVVPRACLLPAETATRKGRGGTTFCLPAGFPELHQWVSAVVSRLRFMVRRFFKDIPG